MKPLASLGGGGVVDIDGDDFCCDLDNLENHRDMKLRYETLKAHVRYLDKILQETILSDTVMVQVTRSSSSGLRMLALDPKSFGRPSSSPLGRRPGIGDGRDQSGHQLPGDIEQPNI